MIPYGHQTIDKKDIRRVAKTLESDWLTQGPAVLEFEKKLAAYCGAKYAVAVANGTAALHLAYLAAGLKEGDEAITTPNTFVATSNMLLILGVKPKFCEIRLDTYNLDERKIENLITKRTKAIVPVHFAGQPCAMKKIKEIASKHKLVIIEDACHALGADYENSKIGSCRHSDMAVFSFHPVKSITTGEGGAILTNNKKYYEKLKLLRSHGIYKNKKGWNVMVEMGYNYRLTDIQSALGLSQLEKLNNFVRQRRKIVGWYGRELGQVKEIILPVEIKGNYSSWHLFVIRTAAANRRDKLAVYLKAKSVGINFHYPAVYTHPFYKRHGYAKLSLPREKIYQQSCLSLPIYPDLKEKQVIYISDLIKKFFRN